MKSKKMMYICINQKMLLYLYCINTLKKNKHEKIYG